MRILRLVYFLLLILFVDTSTLSAETKIDAGVTFKKITSQQSAIHFNNRIKEDHVHNFFNFSYIYNGAGVAVGDLNNDGLADIYFSGNQVSNKLYLNQDGLKFKDITSTAFKKQDSGWSNGVTFVDINNDGYLDIYVSRSGLYQNPSDRENLLYINNGDLTFTERSMQYGLNDAGFSTQAYFFDYDQDNDLDMYLVNHRYDFENNNTVVPRDSVGYDKFCSDQLYRNNGNGLFTNVTQSSGIVNYTWGLSATVADFNEDGWDDIFVANDYIEPDNLYINNKDGTFSDRIADVVKHTSFYSMGSDVGDINNDGLQDLIVLDMVPEDHVRAKRMMASMSTENFWRLIDSGFHYQFMLNTLQLNQGKGVYSEIAQLAGVAKTDWSWAPLFADFNNDGYQDLYVTNGIKRDITDNDFYTRLNALSQSGKALDFNEVISTMPTAKLQNYLFLNQGDLTFKQAAKTAGLTEFTHSNGVAYADFDNDGDLDLVVNNLDEEAGLYQNLLDQPLNHYFKVKLDGPDSNRTGIGASISLKFEDGQQVKRNFVSRGYLSSVQPVVHFGLGKHRAIKQLVVQWPDQKITVINNPKRDQTLTVHYSEAVSTESQDVPADQHVIFTEITEMLHLNYRHVENSFNDFERERLLPHKQSEHGPLIAVGDVNGDQLEDFFVGGAAGSAGKLMVQTVDQTFISNTSQPWELDASHEDLGALLFDVDNDGDLDLYIVSGGNESDDPTYYQDRLYLNDGKAVFSKSDALSVVGGSGMRVVSGDYDQDGDLDVFIGGRVVPGKYPQTPQSVLCRNDQGRLVDVTKQLIPQLGRVGMITDAAFVDYDNDNDLDLVVVGEWMPITIFENRNKRFYAVKKAAGLQHTTGWWQRIEFADIDADGDFDFIAGNIGKNNKYHPTLEKPLTVYGADFDDNGSFDMVLANVKDNKQLPVRGRQCSAEQTPGINSRFPSFTAFAEADLPSIYSAQKLQSALQFNATEFASVIGINNGKKGFDISQLPNMAQVSPISGIVIDDFNQDHHLDILFSGNVYGAEVETVRYDAGIGGLLLGDGTGGFEPLSADESGFFTPYNARDLRSIQLGAGESAQQAVIVSNNNRGAQVFKVNQRVKQNARQVAKQYN